ncbi:MAG: hypothetical protein U0228_24115 [Myxococcaceae bacterium]
MIPPTSTPPPPEAAEPADPFFERVCIFLAQPQRPNWSGLVFLLIIVAVSGSGPSGAAALLGALAMRDLVRLAAMKALGAFDSRLLVLPLGRGELPLGTSATREALVILSGPAFLVVLSLVTYVAAKFTGPGIVLELSRVSVGLAVFTLLPLKPYDGWRLLNVAIFSRWPWVELAVAVLTSLALGALGVAAQAWFLVLFAVLNSFGALRVLKIAAAATLARQRATLTDADTASLARPELRALYDATLQTFPTNFTTRGEPQAQLCATTMREVHLKAVRQPPGVGVSIVLVFIYGALFAWFVAGLLVLLALARDGGGT